MYCHRCGTEWVSELKRPGFKETCGKCNAYLHCCKNCRFYEPGAHNDCHIGTTELVGNKELCNFCDEFECTTSRKSDNRNKTKRAVNEFDSLFGGKMTDGAADGGPKESPKDFDSLFGG